ncbi:hypothetical protein GINT2_001242 [Glugoides intestinalis]
MLLITFIGLALTKIQDIKTSKTEPAQAPAPYNAPSNAPIALHEIKFSGDNIPQAVIQLNSSKTKDLYLMQNSTVDNQSTWKPVYKYDLNNNTKNMILVDLPEEHKEYKNCCFMLATDDGKGAFTKPFTYNEQSKEWCPSRTANEDNVIAYGNPEGPTKYTSQPLPEEKTAAASKKKTTVNSASSFFCTTGAVIVLASALIM